jgi:hypothetical protein
MAADGANGAADPHGNPTYAMQFTALTRLKNDFAGKTFWAPVEGVFHLPTDVLKRASQPAKLASPTDA